jgi:hypothetical protein
MVAASRHEFLAAVLLCVPCASVCLTLCGLRTQVTAMSHSGERVRITDTSFLRHFTFPELALLAELADFKARSRP